MFKLDWIRSYTEPLPLTSYRAVVLSFDVAVKPDDTADYTVCTVWGVGRDRVYHLLDVHRVRLPYHSVLALARDLIARYNAAYVLVEDAANGMALAQELARNNLYLTVPIRPRSTSCPGRRRQRLPSSRAASSCRRRRLAARLPL